MKKEIISIIGGTGDQGRGLALRWARAGYEIILGSRDSSRAQSVASMLTQKLHPASPIIRGTDNREAAANGSIVVLTVPFAAQLPTLREIRDHLLPGTLFVDVTVPLEPAVGGRPTRTLGVWAGSAAEQTAETVGKDIRVVSAFQNVAASVLADLDHQVDCDIIVCGNEKSDRERLQPLVESIDGCRFIDGGVLANSRYVESWTALLIGINIRYRTHSGIRITGIGA